MIIVNGFQLLTIITKHSILDVAAALEPSLTMPFFLESAREIILITFYLILFLLFIVSIATLYIILILTFFYRTNKMISSSLMSSGK